MHPGAVDIEYGYLRALGQRPKDGAAALGLSPYVDARKNGARIARSVARGRAAGAQLQVYCA